jgi:hypothetical protein
VRARAKQKGQLPEVGSCFCTFNASTMPINRTAVSFSITGFL